MIFVKEDRVQFSGTVITRKDDFSIFTGDLGTVTVGNLDEEDVVTVIFDGSQDSTIVEPEHLIWLS